MEGNGRFGRGTLVYPVQHFIDIVYWLFGDMTNFNARFADFNTQHNTAFEDSGLVMFEFSQGGVGRCSSLRLWQIQF